MSGNSSIRKKKAAEMRKVLAIAAIVLLAPRTPFEQSASACTIGVPAGSVTTDGRP